MKRKIKKYDEFILEGITDMKNYKNWKIEYSQRIEHDLHQRLSLQAVEERLNVRPRTC